MTIEASPGWSYPLGATVYPEGVNFVFFARGCDGAELLLFDEPDDAEPSHAFPLDRKRNRNFYYWHIFVSGIGHGQLYGYRVDGPYRPQEGLLFDGDKLLVDPYARSVAPSSAYSRTAAANPGRNWGQAIKSVVVDMDRYDWEGDHQLDRPFAETVIYEMHVRGFTQHPSCDVTPDHRGTYLGVVDKIPYLQSLGVTAVELMPVQHFDAQEAPGDLTNYWGYSPIAFFAPHYGYASGDTHLCAIDEFRDMVKALHQAGIEVILDVVFNHTAEAGEDGPTLSFRGLANRTYYMLEDNGAVYADYSGTGNTVNANNSVVRRMVLDCLHHWVAETHVDGFRFDLASIMSRDEQGQLMDNPPILWEIETDPFLAGTKIIAEAWDAAGLYQVGSFIGHRWAEWNGKYRDDVRRFVKGDPGVVKTLSARINGSPDLYTQPDREPNRSINFVTAHDGFTLNDLVSYNEKHNEDNLEDNRDGADENYSWNCGVEGPTSESDVLALRRQQIRNFMTILFTSQGTPMVLMGDEVRRTQAGNNNPYCQDNEISWFDWDGITEQKDFLRFVRQLISFTQSLEVFRKRRFWHTPDTNGSPLVLWHGVQLNQPDWSHDSRSLAFELQAPDDDEHLYIILNAYWESLVFELPKADLETSEGRRWYRIVDTALASPNDAQPPEEAPPVDNNSYTAQPRSVVVLLARP